MAHDPKTHPTTRTSPAVALQLPPSPAQGVSMPVAGQKPPCRAVKPAVPPRHPLTPQGPTRPAQTLATVTLPQVPPPGEAAHSPRGVAEQPPAPNTHMLPARSGQGCPPPARPSPPAPSPGRSFEEGVFHHSKPGGSAPLFPKGISHHILFQVAPLLPLSQDSSEELHYPLPWVGAEAVCALETPNI